MIICDTNVIIELFKNNEKIKAKIQEIGTKNLAISAISVAELYYGAFNKSELQKIQKHLKHYQLLNLTPQTTGLFIELMQNYSLSHKPFIGDMLIAATVLDNKSELFTLNRKDFSFIPDIQLIDF